VYDDPMRRIPLLLAALSATMALPAREANEQYRQLLAAIAYNHLTIGVSNAEAYSTEGGFAPFFLGFNACARTNLGAPFTPDTELVLIYSVHGGSILGVRYTVHSADPAAWAPLAAIKAKIEAIYHIAMPFDGKSIEQDDVVLNWKTAPEGGEVPGRMLEVYDYNLHDELQEKDKKKP
jgi:hypothetical protein